MYDDPTLRYTEAHNARLVPDDLENKFKQGIELVRDTTAILLDRLQVAPPAEMPLLRRLHLMHEMITTQPSALERFDRRHGTASVTRTLASFYRAAFWFGKARSVEPLGKLPDNAPYNDLDHLLRVLLNDAFQLLAAGPPPGPREAVVYWSVDLSRTVADIQLQDDQDDELAERVWAAAHEAGPLDGWTVVEFSAEADALTDVVVSGDCEVVAFSEPFRAAVESCREPQDDHDWLPLSVIGRDGGSRRYWLLRASGPVTADVWGLIAERVRDRAVVLARGGDDGVAWAGRARDAVVRACPSVEFSPLQ